MADSIVLWFQWYMWHLSLPMTYTYTCFMLVVAAVTLGFWRPTASQGNAAILMRSRGSMRIYFHPCEENVFQTSQLFCCQKLQRAGFSDQMEVDLAGAGFEVAIVPGSSEKPQWRDDRWIDWLYRVLWYVIIQWWNNIIIRLWIQHAYRPYRCVKCQALKPAPLTLYVLYLNTLIEMRPPF